MKSNPNLIRISVYISAIILACMATISVAAQRVVDFKTLSTSDGLSHNIVFDILQDRDGFLWLATQNGLNRYDGYRFQVYQSIPGDSFSLINHFVQSLAEDGQGRIWVGSNGSGLSVWSRKTERFRHYPETEVSEDDHFYHNSIWAILESDAGEIWTGTFGGGLKKLDQASGKYQTFLANKLDPNSLSNNDVRCLIQGRDGNFWLGTFGGGLNRFNPKTEQFTPYYCQDKRLIPRVHNQILDLLEDTVRNGIWVATFGGGLKFFDHETEEMSTWAVQPEEGRIRSLSFDRDEPDVLWMATWKGGLVSLNLSTGKLQAYLPQSGNLESLSDDKLTRVYQDRSGTMWTATYGGGVSAFEPSPSREFHRISKPEYDLKSAYAYSVCEKGDAIWIGTLGGGLIQVNPSTGQTQHFFHEGTPEKTIYSILPIGDELWLGTAGQGVVRWNPETGQQKAYRDLPDAGTSSSADYVWCSLMDKQGRLWLGSFGAGLRLLDTATGVFTVYQNQPGDSTSLAHNTAYSLFEDSRGNFWVGTGSGGLHLMDRDQGTFQRFQNNPSDPHSLSNDFVNVITEDQNGILWIGTSGGLNRLNLDSLDYARFQHYRVKDGLPGDEISGILVDDQNRLWIAANNGIARMDGSDAKPSITVFDPSDGLQKGEFTAGAVQRGKSGWFYFGGMEGVTYFHPDSIQNSGYQPEVVLTDFKLFNESVPLNPDGSSDQSLTSEESGYYLHQPIQQVEEMVLSYQERVLTFDFVSLDLLHPDKNQFAYQLEGFDQDWTMTNGHSVTYTNLSPGEYTFLVKGTNNHGIWSQEPHRLKLTITPPWWETWWFRTTALVALILSTYLYFRGRINKLRKEKQILEEKVAERTQEIQAKALALAEANEQLEEMDAFKQRLTSMLVHDLKNPLTSLLRTTELGLDQSHQKTIEQAAHQMHRLVMNVLDVQKLEESSIALNAQDLEVDRLFHNAINYVALAARQKNLSWTINQEEALSVRCDPALIERVLINLLANAIEVSPLNSSIELKAVAQGRQVSISIEDQGPGISQKKLDQLFEEKELLRAENKYSTGLGLKYCQLALGAHGSVLQAASEKGRGSRFSFSLPQGREGTPTSKNAQIAQDSISLTAEEKVTLSATYEALQQMQVYEGGKILSVLEGIDPIGNIGAWKEALQTAVFSCNQEAYDQCLKLAEQNHGQH
ncbi:hypothetical protein KFE98_07405 [bacterium SCSIO 12741]|nr:hypothetical protein KFE98_07405 [bacterium SCSIO 12741]